MVRQHTLQDRQKREAEDRKKAEEDAKLPNAINHNIGATPQDMLRKNHQIEPETLSADRLNTMYQIVTWATRSHKDGTLSRIFTELGLFQNETEILDSPKPDSKPFEIAPETIQFLNNQIVPALRNQSRSMKQYEQQMKAFADDKEALQLVPAVTKLALPEEIFELIPFLEQIHDAASQMAGVDSLAGALRPQDVDSLNLDAETKKFVKQELSRDQQLQRDHDLIMRNLDNVNVPELQIQHGRQEAMKTLQQDNDRTRLSEGDLQFYHTRGGVAKPYPMSYQKSKEEP